VQVKVGGWRRTAEMGGRTRRCRKGKDRNGGFLGGCNSAQAERKLYSVQGRGGLAGFVALMIQWEGSVGWNRWF